MDELQRVLLRLSQTEDEKLGVVLDKLLPKLLKLLRTSDSTAKLVEIINVALTRVRACTTPLPVCELAAEFLLPSAAGASSAETLFRHLTIVFLDLGAVKSSAELQQKYTSFLLASEAFTHERKFGVSFFLQCLYGLPELQCGAGVKNDYQFTEAWAELAQEFMLIPAGSDTTTPFVPGLPSDVWNIWKPKVAKIEKENMISFKLKILGALEKSPTPLVYPVFLAATAEPYDSVNDLGQTLCARREGALDVDVDFLSKLVALGQRPNCPSKIRVNVLHHLSRSPKIGVQVNPESLNLVINNLKTQDVVVQAALSYVRAISILDDLSEEISVLLAQALETAFWGNGILHIHGDYPEAMKLYAVLSKRIGPHRAISAVPTLFGLLTQYPENTEHILEALGGLLLALSHGTEMHKHQVSKIVKQWLTSSSIFLRREALRWTLHLLDATHPNYFLTALNLQYDKDNEIRLLCEKALARRQMPALSDFMDALVSHRIINEVGEILEKTTTSEKKIQFNNGLCQFLTGHGLQPVEYELHGSKDHPHVRFIYTLLSLGDFFLLAKDADKAVVAYSFVARIVPPSGGMHKMHGADVWGDRFKSLCQAVNALKSCALAEIVQRINRATDRKSRDKTAFTTALESATEHPLLVGALCATEEDEDMARSVLEQSLKETRSVHVLEALRLLKQISSKPIDVEDALLVLSADASEGDNNRAFVAAQLLSHEKALEVAQREHWKDRDDAQSAIALALDPKKLLSEEWADTIWTPVYLCSLLKRMVEARDLKRYENDKDKDDSLSADPHDGLELSEEMVEKMARCFGKGYSGLSLFVSDCSAKGFVRLWMLQPTERLRDVVLKMFGSSTAQKSVNENMFVAAKKEKEAKDSLEVVAKARIEGMTELLFLSREISHPPVLVALLDQPTASSATGICRDAVDVQSLCIPIKLREEVCPEKLLSRFPPFFYHLSDFLRTKVIALCANYFGIEQAINCGTWSLVYPALVESLGHKRVSIREASLLCVTALLRGRSWEELRAHFEPLWVIGVKLMDDLEKRVQAVVGPFSRTLRSVTIRICDCSPGSGTTEADAADAIQVVLPLLLKFSDTYKHAQPLCFDILREISKGNNTSLLAPYLADLVPMLLISLSAMESEGLSYYQLHANAQNATDVADKFEKARVNLSHSSPSHDLLRRLVRFVDGDSFDTLHPQLLRLLRGGVGANTRCGVCDWYEWIAGEKPEAFGAHGGPILKALAGALFDTSGIVRGKAAAALASLARRLGDTKALQKVIDEKLLLDDHSTAFREASAKALIDIGRRCDVGSMDLDAGVLGRLAARAFVLKHSEEERVKKMWEEVWAEYSLPLSSNAGFIIDSLIEQLNSQDRPDRVGAAKGAQELVSAISNEQENEKLKALSKALQKSLANWKGIGHIVKGVAEVAVKVLQRTNDREQAVSALEECRKYASKGDREDRQMAMESMLTLMQKCNLHSEIGYEGALEVYKENCAYMDEKEAEIEAERADNLVDPHLPKIRGRPAGDDFFSPMFEVYADIFENAKDMQNDEDDIEPPDNEILKSFLDVWLYEFLRGALGLRLVLLRSLARIFRHLKTIKVTPVQHPLVLEQVLSAWSDDRIRIRVASFETFAAVWECGWRIDDQLLSDMIRDLGDDVKLEIDPRALEAFLHHLREVAG